MPKVCAIVSFTLSPQLVEAIDIAAKEEKKTRSRFLRDIIEEYLQRSEIPDYLGGGQPGGRS